MNNRQKFFLCNCYGHGVMVTQDVDDDEARLKTIAYLSLWEEGYYVNKPSLWQRLRTAWRVIKTGKVDSDSIVLSKQTAQELGQYLINL